MILSVRTALSPAGSPFGAPHEFDFSGDVPAGQRIVAYAAGIGGFCCNYVTDSAFWAEKMGALNVSLRPTLLGTTVRVASNIAMTDYGGSVGRGPADGSTDPGCQVQVTALALIDTGTKGTEGILGNLCALSSANTPSVDIGTNTANMAFVSGFRVQGSGGSTGSVGGLSTKTWVNVSGSQAGVSGTTSTPGFSTATTTDALFVSTAPAVAGFAIVPAQISWSKADKESGKNGSLSASVTIPSGYSKIAHVGLLIEYLDIVYSDTAEFQMIKALQTGAIAVNGGNVSCTINLNMYDPDFGAHCYIDDSSTATIYVAAQFGN